ncbi:MAG: ABC transporter substrate-binding protein, partial [Desulfovibrionaceae bacterium]|nr:ABC transporter substrate-binding protein [Desulfovibrionaceae bacterium]
GIIYEDTLDERNFIALNQIEAATKHTEVELVSCKTKTAYSDKSNYLKNLQKCYNQLLAQGVDAFFLTYNLYLENQEDQEKQKKIEPLIAANVPVFSQVGVDDVKNGALMSIVDSARPQGVYAANLVQSIANGISPRSLPQFFESPLFLIINLRTASILGWNPSIDVLLRVNAFYD